MFIHKSQNEEGEDMLSKANAKFELSLVWTVHSEALVFSFTERRLVWTILKHLLSFLYALTFRPKSRRNFPINLWYHDSKIRFLSLWQWLFRKEMSVFNGIRNTVVKFTDCVAAGFFHRSQVTGHRSQVTGHRSQVTGHRSQSKHSVNFAM